MKILHLITDLKRGGESSILLSFLPWLKEKGVESAICCFTDNTEGSGESVIADFEQQGVRVLQLGVKSKMSAPRLALLIPTIKQVNPDILHTYLFHPNIVGRMMRVLFPRLKVVSSVVSTDDWKKKRHCLLEKGTSIFCDKILVNAKGIGEQLVQRDKVSADKIHLVYNGVDTSRLKPATQEEIQAQRQALGIGEEDFVVGFVGRLHPEKDPLCALRIFRKFSNKHPKSKMLFVGDGKLRTELEQLARTWGIENKVLFAGTVTHSLARYYGCMDLLMISSVYEGIPGVLFEAMYLKVPVASFSLGCMAELVTNEKTAYLTKSRNEEELLEAVFKGYEDSEMRNEVIQSAHLLVLSRYVLERNFQQRLSLYQSLGTKSYVSPRHRFSLPFN